MQLFKVRKLLKRKQRQQKKKLQKKLKKMLKRLRLLLKMMRMNLRTKNAKKMIAKNPKPKRRNLSREPGRALRVLSELGWHGFLFIFKCNKLTVKKYKVETFEMCCQFRTQKKIGHVDKYL